MPQLPDGYDDDLTPFVRHGLLDAYELTDDELARMLELWRWGVWKRRTMPSAPDHDVRDAAQKLQRHLAQTHDLEVEYNTIYLLKTEIEPLMYLRVLLDVPRAMAYFLRPKGIISFVRALVRARRYGKIDSVPAEGAQHLLYPRETLDEFHGRAPNLLKRRYWRQLSPHTFDERKRLDAWW